MTDGISPLGPEHARTDSKQNDLLQPSTGRISYWRFVWIGIGFAATLWVGSSVYLQKAHELAEIEYQTGNMGEADYEALTLRYAKYAIGFKISAGVIAFGSLLYFINQMGTRRTTHTL